MSHSLVRIPRAQWPKLRDLYVEQKCSSNGYSLLQSLIEWADQLADVTIYSLDGEWEEDGTFLATHLVAVFLNTLSADQQRLRTALQLLRMKTNYWVYGIPDRIREMVEDHRVDRGLAREIPNTGATFWYHIEREKAAAFEVNVPDGLTLRRLDLRHAEQVNDVWPHRDPNSVQFVICMIAYNDSVGVFDAADNLVAWCLRLPIGSLGVLQVADSHRRQGLGSLVVRYMSRLLADKGFEVTAPVVFVNSASRTLFEGLGFKVIDKVWWTMMPKMDETLFVSVKKSHSLVRIPRTQWPKLRDLYAEQKCSSNGYNLLQSLIEWADQLAEVTIYSLDGEWEEDGTFLATHFMAVFLNTLSADQQRLRTALQLLRMKTNYLIYGIPDRIREMVEEHRVDRGLAREISNTGDTFWYHIKREKAAAFEVNVPDGLTLRRLDLRHAEQVNDAWPHRDPNSVQFVICMIAYNDSVGVFDAADNLVAWCLRLPIGSLGVLQVADSHRRQGLGSLVVRYMSRLLADKGFEVTAPVVFVNSASRALFEGLGFKVIDKVWLTIMPKMDE